MRTTLMIIQLIASVILIGSILLQSGSSSGLSGSIGGAGNQLWKKQGRGYEGILNKVTTAGAILFIIAAILLVAIQ